MSASLKPPAAGAGWLWTDAELVRAKELRREGWASATIAHQINAEFGTARTASGIQTMFQVLRRKGLAVDPVPTKQALELHRQRKAELAVANTTRRECLANGRGHWFDSEGPGNRICADCKRLGT